MRRTGSTALAVAAVGGALAASVVAACSNSSGNAVSSSSAVPATRSSESHAGTRAPAPALASASVGTIVITGGYIPEPASPDVAAAYFTVTNNGATAVRLTRVTTSVTDKVMAMNETDSGGVGSMTDMTRVIVPAHGRMRFVPDHAHLMLERPKPLRAGDQVSMTLTFTSAGTVVLTLPVLPLGQTPTTVQASMSMSGMSMPGS